MQNYFGLKKPKNKKERKRKVEVMLYRPISQRLPNQPLAQEQPYGSGKQKRSPLQFSSEPHGCWQFRPNIPSLQAASHQKKRKTNSQMCLHKFLKFCCITPGPDLRNATEDRVNSLPKCSRVTFLRFMIYTHI